ncbi:hypothetical protein [Rhodanobacter sp. B05]|jgi:hypothetical protein|uniref:hypothetical protein n=1 Tax=Rhodanobacter sp. B05 TaxID=1945859 RepID=UPI00111551EC|nr:hypothetical protein [Rhodanobacter sp. B05]
MGIYLFRAACPASKQPSGPRSIGKSGRDADLFFAATGDGLNPTKSGMNTGLFKSPWKTA